jgi:hypothetical protein
MRPSFRLLGTLMTVGAFVVGCSESSNPAAPSELTDSIAVSPIGDAAARAVSSRPILMLDQCDPDSFNAAIGPGTCVNRNGGLAFDVFIALLQKHAQVPSWRFSPGTIHVPSEVSLPVENKGGEVHTFTEVAEFGGGIVPDLNALAGTPVPAPECLTLAGGDFVPAGGQISHTFEPGASEKYQCCIHPWMRAVTK